MLELNQIKYNEVFLPEKEFAKIFRLFPEGVEYHCRCLNINHGNLLLTTKNSQSDKIYAMFNSNGDLQDHLEYPSIIYSDSNSFETRYITKNTKQNIHYYMIISKTTKQCHINAEILTNENHILLSETEKNGNPFLKILKSNSIQEYPKISLLLFSSLEEKLLTEKLAFELIEISQDEKKLKTIFEMINLNFIAKDINDLTFFDLLIAIKQKNDYELIAQITHKLKTLL